MDPLRNIPRLSELSEHLQRLSRTDHGSLSRLTSVSDIQAWTVAKADEYRQFTLALLAIHNLAAPIHRLPTEILERVLLLCWHGRNSLHLSHICSLWRSIIIGSAAFWADAATNCGPLFDKRPVVYDDMPFVDVVLSRSACHSRGIQPFFHGFSPNIVQAVTPYIGNVVSLRVTLDSKSDIYLGLWPVLRSGMPRLNALHLALGKRIVDVRDDDYDGNDSDFEDDPDWDFDEAPWEGLDILSDGNLPQLSRLTCPPTMVRLFGGVPLRHITIAAGYGDPQMLDEDDDDDEATNLRHLEVYRDSLEVLEITGEIIPWEASRPAGTRALRLPSLRDLRITSKYSLACAVLSWLAFPRTTHIHITNNALQHPPFEELFSAPENNTTLRSAVATIDHVCIQCSSLSWSRDHILLCFADKSERLRLEKYMIASQGLVDVFAANASLTRLTLSLVATQMGQAIEFRAFPHLVHLDMTGPDLVFLARLLGPINNFQAHPAEPVLCPALADLVITFGLEVQQKAKLDRDPSPSPARAGVDKVFKQRCFILQQALARRASSGTRLTSLTLRLYPATIHGQAETSRAGNVGSAERRPIWPSPAARQSVVESLQGLVDGPVVLKLLTRGGLEIDEETVI